MAISERAKGRMLREEPFCTDTTLEYLYYTRRCTLALIGKIYGVSRERVRQRMEKIGRVRRSVGNRDGIGV